MPVELTKSFTAPTSWFSRENSSRHSSVPVITPILDENNVSSMKSGLYKDSPTPNKETVLRMGALWQLLVTGFEITKYPNGANARTRVLWLTLDGRLCLGHAKTEKYAGNAMKLWDIEHFEKGCNAPQFQSSMSWRETNGKEDLCLSIRSKYDQYYALQVVSTRVRNILVENMNEFLNRMKIGENGDFPRAVQYKIARRYASTGEVISMQEVRNIMLREGSDMTQLHVPISSYVSDEDDE